MKEIQLVSQEYTQGMGDTCPFIKPNVTESSLFLLDGEPIGFYLKELPEKVVKLLSVADTEFRSDRVDKDSMNRGTKKQAEARGEQWIEQYSALLGGTPPKEHFKRFYNGLAKASHDPKSQVFAEVMYSLAIECEEIFAEHLPEKFKVQQSWIQENVDKPYQIGTAFTSSISNFNIAAAFHQDKANLKPSTNLILTRRKDVLGGCLTVPEYGVTIEQADFSLLTYPAVSNMHGVTPIVATKRGGYRNSFVFYALKNLKRKDPGKAET